MAPKTNINAEILVNDKIDINVNNKCTKYLYCKYQKEILSIQLLSVHKNWLIEYN